MPDSVTHVSLPDAYLNLLLREFGDVGHNGFKHKRLLPLKLFFQPDEKKPQMKVMRCLNEKYQHQNVAYCLGPSSLLEPGGVRFSNEGWDLKNAELTEQYDDLINQSGIISGGIELGKFLDETNLLRVFSDIQAAKALQAKGIDVQLLHVYDDDENRLDTIARAIKTGSWDDAFHDWCIKKALSDQCIASHKEIVKNILANLQRHYAGEQSNFRKALGSTNGSSGTQNAAECGPGTLTIELIHIKDSGVLSTCHTMAVSREVGPMPEAGVGSMPEAEEESIMQKPGDSIRHTMDVSREVGSMPEAEVRPMPNKAIADGKSRPTIWKRMCCFDSSSSQVRPVTESPH